MAREKKIRIIEEMIQEIFDHYSRNELYLSLKNFILFAKQFEIHKFNQALALNQNQLHVPY
jgi:hypothetical protein